MKWRETSLESWTVETGFRRPGRPGSGTEGGPPPGIGIAGRLALTGFSAWCSGMVLAAWRRPGLGPTSWPDNQSPLFKNSFIHVHCLWRKSKLLNPVCLSCSGLTSLGTETFPFPLMTDYDTMLDGGSGAGPPAPQEPSASFSTSALLFKSSFSVSRLLRGNHGEMASKDTVVSSPGFSFIPGMLDITI